MTTGSAELREAVLQGRIRFLAGLLLPVLAFAGLFANMWLGFPDGRTATAGLAVGCLAAVAAGAVIAGRCWRRPAAWRTVVRRFAVFECVGVIAAGPAYAFIMIDQQAVQAIVMFLSWTVLPRLPSAIATMVERGAGEIARLPAPMLADSPLEVLVPPYRMELLDENMGWRERRHYKKQLQEPPLYLGIGRDALWLEREPAGALGNGLLTRMPLSKVTHAAVRDIRAEHTYEPVGNHNVELTVYAGTTVAITFGDLGEWLFPCPVGADNVAELVNRRAKSG